MSAPSQGAHDPACGPHGHVARAPVPRAEDLERAAGLLRALGDASRLALVFRLAEGGLCVGELADASGAKLSTLSQQLRVLHAERLVTRRREGKHIRYALADEHVRALASAALEHAQELSPGVSVPRVTSPKSSAAQERAPGKPGPTKSDPKKSDPQRSRSKKRGPTR